MAYTLSNLQTDIRNYTEVSDTVLTDAIVNTFIVNAENKIYREADSDEEESAEELVPEQLDTQDSFASAGDRSLVSD